MNITELFKNCKEKLKTREKDIFLTLLIIFIAFLSFGVGRLSKIFENKTPIQIQNSETENPDVRRRGFEESASSSISSENINITNADGKIIVASKKGTKYYFMWCDGVKKIKEENKIWFKTKEEAEQRGLKPAKNCSGL